MLIMHCLTCCVKVAGFNFPPAGSQPPKAALLRPISLPEDKTFLSKCENTFLIIWGSDTSLSCTDSAVPGRAKLRSNLLTHARLKTRILGIAQNFPIRTGLMLLSRFSDVFYVDASTKETIIADLTQIALAKGQASLREPHWIGFLCSLKSGCFCSTTRTIRPSTFVHTFPSALTVIS